MESKVKWSLKFKILTMISVILLLGLGTFLFTMTSLVQKDKTAYLFDNGLQTTRNISQSLRLFLNQTSKDLAFILGDLDSQRNSFGSAARARWRWQRVIIKASIYQKKSDGSVQWISEIEKPRAKRLERWSVEQRAQVFSEMKDQATLFFPIDDHGFAKAIYKFQGAAAFYAVLTLDLRQLLSSIANDRGEVSLILNHRNELILANRNPSDFSGDLVRKLALKDGNYNGSKTVEDENGRSYLVSYSSLDNNGLVIAQVTPRLSAFLPVYIAIERIVYLFFGLLSSLFGIGIFASSRLTSPLLKIKEAAESVGRGEFSVELNVETTDEIGLLAGGFNKMSSEVSRLMDENMRKGRMEAELETAKTVQETLFPREMFFHKNLIVEGFSQPASECGGDWWFYHEFDDSVLVILGDATGHGAPAALLTASARAAFSVVQRKGVKSPKDVVQLMNETLHDTAKGKINMTAFVGLFYKDEPKLKYSLASHNPPYVLPQDLSESTKAKQLKTLAENNHPRLGERLDVNYTESEVEFLPNQHLVVFTDGLTELQNPEGKDWGERKFAKSIIQNIASTSNLNAALKQVERDADDYRKGHEFEDDWTIVFIKRNA